MAGQFRENWKRMANKLPPLTIPTAFEDKDLVRIEDLDGIPGLTPSSGAIIVGSGSEWITFPLGPEGYVLKSIDGLVAWRPDGSGAGGGGFIGDLTASGFVVGPDSATDSAIALYDGTTGKLIKNSSITSDGSGLVVPGDLIVEGTTTISGDLNVLGDIVGLDISASGFVVGPDSATDSAFALYDGTTGKLIKNSAITSPDGSGLVVPGTLTVNNITSTGIFVTSVDNSSNPTYEITNSYFNGAESGVTVVALPPSPVTGQRHIIKDIAGVAGTSNITVNGSGNTIDGQSTFTIASDWEAIELIFGPTEWNII